MAIPDTARPSLATHLIYAIEADEEDCSQYEQSLPMECSFCGAISPGQPAEEAISHKYFTDYDLMVADTGHVCAACAFCMDHRRFKQGHWVATSETYERVSTGDLSSLFERVREGHLEAPLALHVSENPIRSEHAYLWTPVVYGTDPLVVDYDGQEVRIEWDELGGLLAAVEDLRWAGARFDDIRTGEHRLSSVQRLGREKFDQLAERVDPHRRTPLLEVALTLSRGRDDQGRPSPEARDTPPAQTHPIAIDAM